MSNPILESPSGPDRQVSRWFVNGPLHEPEEIPAEKGNSTSQAPVPFTTESPPTSWPTGCMPRGMTQAAEAIAEHVQAPIALAGMAVLGAVTHVVMGRVDACHPITGARPASLYILVALESGGRKSECFSLATEPISKIEQARREAHLAEIKRLRGAAERVCPKKGPTRLNDRPPDPRTVFVDTTTQAIEQAFINGSSPALSLSTDEGGTLLAGYSLKSETRSASLSTLTRLFDGSGVQRDRVGEGQSGFRFRVRFGLFLSAQPVVLRDVLSDELLRGQGFLPRFIYSAPASLAGSRLHNQQTLSKRFEEDQRLLRYWGKLKTMFSTPLVPDEHGGLVLPTVSLAPAAKSEWLEFYNATEIKQGPRGEYAHMTAFASRAGELSCRVAAVYAAWRHLEHGGEWKDIVVNVEDMQQAASLIDYSLSEWHRQSESVAMNMVERDANNLLLTLQRNKLDTLSRSDISRFCQNELRKDRRRRNAAIDELVHRRWLLDSNGRFKVVRPEHV